MLKTLKLMAGIIGGVLLTQSGVILAETVGVFVDQASPQFKFAAGDLEVALKEKGLTVEILPLSALNPSYANKKVVISLTTDATVTGMLTAQGGTVPGSLGAQAYALRSTTQGQASFWVLGGDTTGTMYGGLEMAENIQAKGFTGTYTKQESPKILNRGIKLNLPLNDNSNTYFNANISAGAKNAIPNVWDLTFWTTWFDEMARNRYNVVSVWNNHAFTSMLKMADYPDVAIQNVTGYKDIFAKTGAEKMLIKTMTIDQKIDHWKKVMAYAKSRGFKFYLFNWNFFLDGAEGKHGLVRDIGNPATIAYVRKCMYELFKTYSDLDGFGITQGEAMDPPNREATDAEKSVFLAKTYGLGLADYAKENPTRQINFIHRWWLVDADLIKVNFAELLKQKNVTFDMSFKYNFAHMYSSTTPSFFDVKDDVAFLKATNFKTWFTVRDDDFYYHNWGNPEFAREFIKNIPGQGDYFKGFYMGSDGFNPTRTFFSKNSISQGSLEVQRMWYKFMIWGRLTYNPDASDDIFKELIKKKFKLASADILFDAWAKASRSVPKMGEMLFDQFKNDQSWYPENSQSKDGFTTIEQFLQTGPREPTKLCGMVGTAANSCGSKITSYVVADQMEADALSALTSIGALAAPANSELGIALNTIRSMSYLSAYYAYKVRGATYLKNGDNAKKTPALSKAYCWWSRYTNLMDSMYTGMTMQRNLNFDTWHAHDAAVLKEYQSHGGGTAIPKCDDLPSSAGSFGQFEKQIVVNLLTRKGLQFDLPQDGFVSISVFNNQGSVQIEEKTFSGKKGKNELKFGRHLGRGMHLVQIKLENNLSVVKKLTVYQ